MPSPRDASQPANEPKSWGVAGNSRAAWLKRNFPTVEDLRRRAQRRVPRLGYDTVAGGTGSDLCVARNAASLDAIQIVPRYGVDRERVSTEIELFGRTYAAPLGVAPMGLQGVIWPGAERHLAIPSCLNIELRVRSPHSRPHRRPQPVSPAGYVRCSAHGCARCGLRR